MRHLICLALCLLLCGCGAVQLDAPAEQAVCSTDIAAPSEPDYEALARCSLYAQDLGQKFGMEIRVYRNAANTAPWDYSLEYEDDPVILMNELAALEHHLQAYPAEILRSLAGLKISLVRRISGIPGSGSPEEASGIQFRDGENTYIALATCRDTEAALYHELWHIMEPTVLSRSAACDRWETLNPSDFRYENEGGNLPGDHETYLQAGQEYFIDDYAMGYASEDRARLMEYAMLPGQSHRFRSPYLQAKLYQLCLGIREAFCLETAETAFLWEQYLSSSLS